MTDILFGPSGLGDAFYNCGFKTSIEAPKWLESLDLNAFEYSFGRGFTLGIDKAKIIGEQAKEHNVLVSVHAPFYINFANPDELMADKSLNYILKSFEYLRAFGGKHVVVHIGTMGKMERNVAINLIKTRLKNCVNVLKSMGYGDLFMCIESMGKSAQIGTYEEVVQLCEIDEMLIPCLDFGHINSILQGGLKNQSDFQNVFAYCIDKLGYERMNNCHIHFSKIQYGVKGEIKHLNFDDEIYGPEFLPCACAIKALNLHPHVICESTSHMSEDAIKMKETFFSLN